MSRLGNVHAYLQVPAHWPVKEDIKHEIVLMPNERDIKKAKRKDPRGCALHNAACRMFNVPNCAIGAAEAFIPQRDAKGNYYIARVQADRETREAIKKFDNTGKMPEGGFRFIPLSKSSSYKYKRAYMRNYLHSLTAEEKQKPTKHNRGQRKRILRAIPRALNG